MSNIERTLSIIKPDAVERNLENEIKQMFKDKGFQITKEKKQNINFIVENSKDENTDFLSDVINQSDDKNTGEVIEKIIDTQDSLVEGVVEISLIKIINF